MTEPTPEEIAKVKRWECETQGHEFTEVLVFGSLEPQAVMCSRCGQTWEIGNDLLRAIIVIGPLDNAPAEVLDKAEAVIQIDGDGARLAKHPRYETWQFRLYADDAMWGEINTRGNRA